MDAYARGNALYSWIAKRGYFRSNDGLPFRTTTVTREGASETALDFFLLRRRMCRTTHWVQSAVTPSPTCSAGDHHFPVILNALSRRYATSKRGQRLIR